MHEGKISEETARFLVSEIGRELLAETASQISDPTHLTLRLRKQGHAPERIIGIVTVAQARQRARKRFPDADHLFFTEDALAQATSPVIAAYHAKYLATFGTVADLGCGIGMDAIALAKAGANVLAIERDPARLIFAQVNAELCGVADRITFQLGDVTTLDWKADAAYWDPSRRDDTTRFSTHADRYEPPLSFLETIRTRVRGGAVKLSPALPDEVLLPSPRNRGEGGMLLKEQKAGGTYIEFLSENRECKEACLWFGEARGAAGDLPSSAVLLPEETVLVAESEPAPLHPLGAFVFDPDPALIRAHALGTLAETYGIGLISPDDTYLTGDTPLPARLASAYRIQEALTYRPRDLSPLLRDRGIGRLVTKKRHFPREPDAVHRELGLKGKGAEATLILVREGPRFLALLCDRHESGHSA